MKIALQALTSFVIGLVLFVLLVFWPAGTFDYWQGWAFIAVGMSKFVIRPGFGQGTSRAELAELANAIGDLQT